jgi:hypothetical protein
MPEKAEVRLASILIRGSYPHLPEFKEFPQRFKRATISSENRDDVLRRSLLCGNGSDGQLAFDDSEDAIPFLSNHLRQISIVEHALIDVMQLYRNPVFEQNSSNSED